MSAATDTLTIRAEIVGSSEASAEGITVSGRYAPVLALCRALLEAGYDPDSPLEAYRGNTLCLRVRSIGDGARLRASERSDGKPVFTRLAPIDPTQDAPDNSATAPRTRSLASGAA
jgi:hypothetical protein